MSSAPFCLNKFDFSFHITKDRYFKTYRVPGSHNVDFQNKDVIDLKIKINRPETREYTQSTIILNSVK